MTSFMKSVSLFSKAGGHTTNEDAARFHIHPADESVLICALADGQGGRPGGQEAAEAACRAVVENALDYSPKQLSKPKTWLKILRAADLFVHGLADAGATTLVGLCVTDQIVCGASSGDSAAVLLNVYDRYHELTARQTKNPPVGSGQANFVPFSEQLIDPWLVMLASDGLWKYVGWNGVKTILQKHQLNGDQPTINRGETLVNALASAARAAGQGILRDDTTLILVEPADFSDGSAREQRIADA